MNSQRITVQVLPLSGSNSRWQVEVTTETTTRGVKTVEYARYGKYASRSVADRYAEKAAAELHGFVK